MSATVQKALTIWGMPDAQAVLIAARENAVYRVQAGGQVAALRLHRKGYRTDAELWSELKWMEAVATGGIRVPAPIPSASGDVLLVIDDVQVDMLTWLPGKTLDAALPAMAVPARAGVFATLGQQMARMHGVCDDWTPPAGFQRVVWDRDGLLGDDPLWGRFWDNPALRPEEQALFQSFRAQARRALEGASDGDFGLIHADLVPANVMIDDAGMHFIDFDDGGFGYRLFDVATALAKHIDADDFEALKRAMIEGYQSAGRLDVSGLDLFLALRAATYVGWNISRADEDSDGSRNARFIHVAKRLVAAYLG